MRTRCDATSWEKLETAFGIPSDLYYAKTLHALGDSREAADLRESLDGWAVQMVNKALEFFESLQRERVVGESSGRPN